MSKIELVTVVVTRMGVSATIVGNDCLAVREHYATDEHGLLGCISGNFEEEPLINTDENLLEAVTQLVDQARDVFRSLAP